MKRKDFFAGIALGALILTGKKNAEALTDEFRDISDLADNFSLELDGIMTQKEEADADEEE